MINILTESSARVALLDRGKPVEWRAVAKDGADLPPALATLGPARLTFLPGEILDFEYVPAGGDLVLGFGKGPPWDNTWTRVPVRVR